MIITKLKGGLGNQMFQYAIAKGAQKKNEKLYMDISSLKNHQVENERLTVRNFELNLFPNLAAETLTDRKREFYFSQQRRFILLRKILGIKILKISQTENELVEIPKTKKILFFDGFFQSEKYFKPIRNILLSNFEFPESDAQNMEIEREILNSNSISIHIRRGDYMKKSVKNYHGILPESYYKNAIELIESQENNIKYFVFSDNPEIAREIFKNHPNFVFIENNTGENSWKDMRLMSKCKHHIIANSSFSWWGAWLSVRKGITVAPKNWFNPEVANFKIDDFIPEKWVKI